MGSFVDKPAFTTGLLPKTSIQAPSREVRDLEREALEQYDQTCEEDLERNSSTIIKEKNPDALPAIPLKRKPPTIEENEEKKRKGEEVEGMAEGGLPEPLERGTSAPIRVHERGKKYSRLRMIDNCCKPVEKSPLEKPLSLEPKVVEAPAAKEQEEPSHQEMLERKPTTEKEKKPMDKKKSQKKLKTGKSKRRGNFSVAGFSEVQGLILRLKTRVLNYLRNTDLRLGPECQLDKVKTEKETVRQLLYNGALPKPLCELVRINDICDLETLKGYIKEHGLNTRRFLHQVYKRVRVEFMESTSNFEVVVSKLTTREKRKVRKLIQRSLFLAEKAMELRKVGKKAADGLRRDVMGTLTLIHQTMEVVYSLRDFTKEAYEDLEIERRWPGADDPLRMVMAYLKIVRKEGYMMDHVYFQLRPSCLLKVAFLRYMRNYGIMDEGVTLQDIRPVSSFMELDSIICFQSEIVPLFTLAQLNPLIEMRRFCSLSETILVVIGWQVFVERCERARFLKSLWPRDWWSMVVEGPVEPVTSGYYSDPRVDPLLVEEDILTLILAQGEEEKDPLGEQIGEGDRTPPPTYNPHCSLQ